MEFTCCVHCAVNVLADHAAATQMKARHISELRRQFSEPDMLLLHKLTLDAVADEHLPQRVIRSKSLEVRTLNLLVWWCGWCPREWGRGGPGLRSHLHVYHELGRLQAALSWVLSIWGIGSV